MADKFRIGLIGFGNIGTGFVQQFLDHSESMSRTAGRTLEIAAIADREFDRPRDAQPPETTRLTTDWKEITADPSIDMVVELVGVGADGKPTLAREIAAATLSAGKAFTTANKALIATHGAELCTLAEQHSATLLYEATVGAGTPTIGPLQSTLASNEFLGIHGILNGTTNYIISRMKSDSALTMESAIKEAQDLGYAEPDPTADVEGHDAMYKIAILGSLAFGKRIPLESVHCEGITHLSPAEFAVAKANGWAIKLLASAKKIGGRISATVGPVFIPSESMLASVNEVYNAMQADARPGGSTLYWGQGAGRGSTGAGLWSDCILAARHPGEAVYPFTISQETADMIPVQEVSGPHYFRLPEEGQGLVQGLPGVQTLHHAEGWLCIQTGEMTEADAENFLRKLGEKGIARESTCHVRYALIS